MDDDDSFCVMLDGEGKIDGTTSSLDMSTRSWDGAIDPRNEALLDELRTDCAALSFPASSGTFWLPAERAHAITRTAMGTAEPSAPPAAGTVSLAEQLAAQVFAQHTAAAALHGHFDPARSGAEFWAQVRRPGAPHESIGMHWDKDEWFFADCAMFVHPQLSTVTYLAEGGAPTFVADGCTPQAMSDATRAGGGGAGAAEGLHASFPRVGKHLVFDGQLLHGAPAAWRTAAAGAAPAPAAAAAAAAAAAEQRPAQHRAPPRVTFLVNIWLNHRPMRVRPLPPAKAALLSRAAAADSGFWRLSPSADPRPALELALTAGCGASLWELPLHQTEQRQVLRCRLPCARALAQGALDDDAAGAGVVGETIAVSFGEGAEIVAATEAVATDEGVAESQGSRADVERMLQDEEDRGGEGEGERPAKKQKRTTSKA